MSHQLRIASLLALTVLFVGCRGSVPIKDSSGQDLMGKDAYTVHTMRPDRARGRLYALNYLLADAPLPRCSKVQILKASAKAIVFKDVASGMEYQYLYHKASGPSIAAAAERAFSHTCDNSQYNKMSAKDREGIKKGEPLVGMTKAGVLLATGYPPISRTPSTDANEWVYWRNRFNTILVKFNSKGVVSEIVD